MGATKEQFSNLHGSSVSSQMADSHIQAHSLCPFKLALIKLIPSIPYSWCNCSESIRCKRVWQADVICRIILMPLKTINFIWNMTMMKHRIMLQACACRCTHSYLTSVCLPLLFYLLAYYYFSFSFLPSSIQPSLIDVPLVPSLISLTAVSWC